MNNWQLIKTAPKDGTHILLYDGSKQVAKWSEDRWETGWLIMIHPCGDVNDRIMVDNPTYWMTLPEDPNEHGEPDSDPYEVGVL